MGVMHSSAVMNFYFGQSTLTQGDIYMTCTVMSLYIVIPVLVLFIQSRNKQKVL
jgi:hypothetical protein